MNKLEVLRKNNPALTIHHVEEERTKALRPYGRVLDGYDAAGWCRWMEGNLTIPEGTSYEASLTGLENQPLHGRVARECFGTADIQSGACWGMNSRMNGMEFHKSSEVLVAQTPLVLILGKRQDVIEGRWDAALAEFFYLPAGCAVELYSTSMHLAPCRVDPDGFRAAIVLPRGTNAPLDQRPAVTDGREEAQWLFAVNKWMICHPDSPQKGRGAWPGIDGENWEVSPLGPGA